MWHDLGVECTAVQPTVWQSLSPLLTDKLARLTYQQHFGSADTSGIVNQSNCSTTSGSDTHASPPDRRSGARSSLIVHSFSNGGFLLFSALLQAHADALSAVQDQEQHQQQPYHTHAHALKPHSKDGTAGRSWQELQLPVDALIFDSAPAPITEDMVLRFGAASSRLRSTHSNCLLPTLMAPLDMHDTMTLHCRRCSSVCHSPSPLRAVTALT